jgi:hypothetical protein
LKVFLPYWAYHDYTPPKASRKDPAAFDRGKGSRKYRLFDGELKKTVEERPDESRNPYSVKRRRPRQYRNRLTGELVQRYRGGKNFELVLTPWSREGLIARRVLVVGQTTESGGRALHGSDYPKGWAGADPGYGPYKLRSIAELAMAGADVSGCNIPGAAKFAECAKSRVQRVAETVYSLGPEIDERAERGRRLPFISIDGDVTWRSTDLPPERAWHQAELRERKSFGRERVWVPGMPLYVDRGRRAKTSERRNEQGEYGAETRVTHDGRVIFGKKLPLLPRAGVQVSLKSYTKRRAVMFKDGRRRKIEVQMAPGDARSKPGPKPKYGFTMGDRLRKIKQRCEERGVPFVIADHLKLPAVSPPANSPAGAVSPRTRPPYQPLVEIEQMIERLLQRAEKWDDYCGEILDRLADAPPDYILTQEEFTVVAAAAVLADSYCPLNFINSRPNLKAKYFQRFNSGLFRMRSFNEIKHLCYAGQ